MKFVIIVNVGKRGTKATLQIDRRKPIELSECAMEFKPEIHESQSVFSSRTVFGPSEWSGLEFRSRFKMPPKRAVKFTGGGKRR